MTFPFHSTRLIRILEWKYRQLNSDIRALPNCYILGAQKAGTSSLYQYLIQHSEVHPSYLKEVHFFDGGIKADIDNYAKSINWYKAHFPLNRSMKRGDICIDATPMYLFNPDCPTRIKQLTPNAKFIVLMRDPAERAISHYHHSKRHGFESLTPMDAFLAESSRLSKVTNYKDISFRVHSYLSRGIYIEQIKRYLEYFNEEQFLFLNSEQFFTEPSSALKQVYNFLGITEVLDINLQAHNVGKNKQQISTEVAEYLSHYYREHNEQLFEFLGQRYDW